MALIHLYHRRVPAGSFDAQSDSSLFDRAFDALGHFAIWAGLYVAGCAACMELLATGVIDWRVIVFAFLLTVSVYLLDRVKFRGTMLDPADAVAHPKRAAFLSRYATFARGLMLTTGVAAAVLAWMIAPLCVLLVPAAHVGVLLYGSVPRRPRVKDVLVLKNVAVAGAVTALAAAIQLLRDGAVEIDVLNAIAGAGGFIALHVFADAVLCDIDDADADRKFGTRTIPNIYGETAAWRVVFLINIIAGAWLELAGQLEWVPRAAATIFAVCYTGATLLLWFLREGDIRDAVDLKLPLATGVALSMLYALS